MHYPRDLIALEKEIKLGPLRKRFDILVFDPQHQPWMLIECKAPQVPLSDAVFSQVLRYHITLPARYLIITNGNATMGWEKENNQLREIELLPEFFADH